MDRRLRELRARIRELENRIAGYERQLAANDRERSEAVRRSINELGADMQRQLASNRAQMQQSVNALSREMSEEYNKSLERLSREYNRLQERIAELNREYQDCLNEMQREIDKLKNEKDKHLRIEKESVRIELEELQRLEERVSKLPHEFFAEGRFEIYAGQGRRVSELSAQGLNQTAIGTAISAQTGLREIETQTKLGVNRWKDSFDYYEGLAHSLETAVKEAQRQLRANYEDLCDEAQLRFWSEGSYGELINELDGYLRRIADIRSLGINAYLKQNRDFTISIMQAESQSMIFMHRRLALICEYVQNALEAYYERCELAQALAELLESEQNMELSELRFEGAGESEAAKAEFKAAQRLFEIDTSTDMDIRKRLNVKLKSSAEAEYNFCLVPVRVHELDVTNELLVYAQSPNRGTQMGLEGMVRDIQSQYSRFGVQGEDCPRMRFCMTRTELNSTGAGLMRPFTVNLSKTEKQELLNRYRVKSS